MEDKQIQRPNIQVKIDEKDAEGIYSNFFVIAHSSAEFLVDFGRLLPGLKNAKILSRIILSPIHALRLKKLLEDNISNFEKKFGKIHIDEKSGDKSMGFNVDRGD